MLLSILFISVQFPDYFTHTGSILIEEQVFRKSVIVSFFISFRLFRLLHTLRICNNIGQIFRMFCLMFCILHTKQGKFCSFLSLSSSHFSLFSLLHTQRTYKYRGTIVIYVICPSNLTKEETFVIFSLVHICSVSRLLHTQIVNFNRGTSIQKVLSVCL